MKTEPEASSESFESSEADEKLAEVEAEAIELQNQQPGPSKHGGSSKRPKKKDSRKRKRAKNGSKQSKESSKKKKKRKRRGGIRSLPIKVLTHPLDRSIAFVFVV